jgi:hypothetical protein
VRPFLAFVGFKLHDVTDLVLPIGWRVTGQDDAGHAFFDGDGVTQFELRFIYAGVEWFDELLLAPFPLSRKPPTSSRAPPEPYFGQTAGMIHRSKPV